MPVPGCRLSYRALGDQADRLALLCGYLPLALRVAASTLAEHIDLSSHDYVQRLTATQQRLGLVDASLSVSFALLPPALQQQWCLLALFPSLFDAEAAATLLELDAATAQDVLSTLVRSSLVEWTPDMGRYRLHDLARVFAQAHLERTREHAPLDWARTQHTLGCALLALGGREAGTARLEEAVQACQAALQEYTRERVPFYWAQTQQSLGNALRVLGEWEKDAALLCAALESHTAAWGVFAEAVPYYASRVASDVARDIEVLKRDFAPALYQDLARTIPRGACAHKPCWCGDGLRHGTVSQSFPETLIVNFLAIIPGVSQWDFLARQHTVVG